MTWRDIKDAPRDGTAILAVVDNDIFQGAFVVALWAGEYSGWSMPGFCGLTLSHWMPLPPPPGEGVGFTVEGDFNWILASAVMCRPEFKMGDRVRVTVTRIEESDDD